MNKKAQGPFVLAHKILFMFGTLILIAISIGLIVLFLMKTNAINYTEDLKAEIYSWQIINQPQCLAYENKLTGGTRLWVIDENKISSEQLEKCLTIITNKKQVIASQVMVVDAKTTTAKFMRTRTWDESTNPDYIISKPVLIRNKEKTRLGVVTIELKLPADYNEALKQTSA